MVKYAGKKAIGGAAIILSQQFLSGNITLSSGGSGVTVDSVTSIPYVDVTLGSPVTDYTKVALDFHGITRSGSTGQSPRLAAQLTSNSNLRIYGVTGSANHSYRCHLMEFSSSVQVFNVVKALDTGDVSKTANPGANSSKKKLVFGHATVASGATTNNVVASSADIYYDYSTDTVTFERQNASNTQKAVGSIFIVDLPN